MKTFPVYFGILTIATALSCQTQAQKQISGKSEPTKLTLKVEYKRGLPPNLFVNMNFEDDNNNGILEANESARLRLELINRGGGTAQGLTITLKDNNPDQELKISSVPEIPYILPDESYHSVITFTAGMGIKTLEHKFDIIVKEHFGYDMDPAYLTINTIQFSPPELVFSGMEIIDVGQGTFSIKDDGKLQAGEQIKVKIYVQNVGQNIAPKASYWVRTNDPDNIYLADFKGDLGDLGIGQVAEFWVTISPNKRVNTSINLPVFLTLTNDYNRGNLKDYQLPLAMDQKPPEVATLEVKADIDKYAKQVARFEYNSNRINANVGNMVDINIVPPSKTQRPNSIGIVIGIEDYQYFVDAPYADNDAVVMTKYFKDVLGIENVITYKSTDATGFFFGNIFDPNYGQIQKAVMKGVTEVFVYYSGHGIPSKDGSKVYLLPSDGRLEAVDFQGYDLSKLYQNLETLNAKSVTIFMDACFSGGSRPSETLESKNLVAMKGAVIDPQVDKPWLTNPNFTVFTSSEYNETSLGFDVSGNGLFTYFLCAGLQGSADSNEDNTISANELKTFVIERVKETSVKISGVQTPKFYGNLETIFVNY